MKQKFLLKTMLLLSALIAGSGSAWATDVTYKLELVYTDFNTTSYSANNGSHSKDAVCTTDASKKMSVNYTTNQIMQSGSAIQWQKSKGYIYNTTNLGTISSVTVTSTAGSFTTYYGTSEQPTSGNAGSGKGYFKTSVGSATGTASKIEVVFTVTEGGGSSAAATTTSIDASGITNTDLKDGTAAGSLSASVTVTEGSAAVPGATVTWSGDNDAVATINASTGAVTLVDEGTVNFTASYAGVENTYAASTSSKYEMTVTDTRYTISDLNFTAAYGSGPGKADDDAEWTVTSDGTESNFDSTLGIHYGTNNAQVQYVQLSTSDIKGTIKKVKVTTRDAQESGSVTVTVGGSSFNYGENTSVTATNTSTEYTFTGSGKGQIIVRVDRGSANTKAIYVKRVKVYYEPSTDPVISASDVDITYDATSGSIDYTLENATGNVSATVTTGSDWLDLDEITSSSVSFTCSANPNNTSRTATVTLSLSGADDKVVTVTQAAAPVVYTTIPALFNAATSTATDVNVTFGGWVISAVHNDNAYLTDNQGHGLIIYASSHGFQVNDVLTGTVSCKLQTYRGSAELTNLTSSTTGLSVANNGTVTEQNIAISDLGGVNTGALLAYEGLTYNGTALVDGSSNTITPYNTLYSGTFENGKTYNVTGVYLQYNSTKEILPRSADDIEEVVVITPTITVSSASLTDFTYEFDNGPSTTKTISVSGSNLTAGITLSLDNNSNFEMSTTEGSGYTNSLSLTQTNGAVAATTVYVRLKAGLAIGNSYSGTITLTSTDADNASVSLSGSVTAPVVDYATLPFSFDSGKSDIENTNGLTQSGLDSDYGSSPKLKFKNQGSYVILKINEVPGTLSYKIKGNPASGKSSIEGTFDVLISDDGVTYSSTPLAEYTSLGSEQAESFTLPSSTRFIKWIYTEKTSGNVALGDIKLTKPVVKLNSSGYATYANVNAIDFSGATDYTAWAVKSISGEAITFEKITGAVAGGTGVLLMGNADGEANLTFAASGTDISSNNKLIGITTATTVVAGDYYGLSGNTFVPVNAGTVPAGKALLPKSVVEGSGVKAFTFVFEEDDPTGISTINGEGLMVNDPIYNLAGQRISKMQKGINIVNGKKVLK